MTPPDDAPPAPTVAFISRYPTVQDLEEALGPPRSEPVPTATFPRFIHEIVDEPPTGFPRKVVSLVASAPGSRSRLETAAGRSLFPSPFRSIAATLWTSSRRSLNGLPLPTAFARKLRRHSDFPMTPIPTPVV